MGSLQRGYIRDIYISIYDTRIEVWGDWAFRVWRYQGVEFRVLGRLGFKSKFGAWNLFLGLWVSGVAGLRLRLSLWVGGLGFRALGLGRGSR